MLKCFLHVLCMDCFLLILSNCVNAATPVRPGWRISCVAPERILECRWSPLDVAWVTTRPADVWPGAIATEIWMLEANAPAADGEVEECHVSWLAWELRAALSSPCSTMVLLKRNLNWHITDMYYICTTCIVSAPQLNDRLASSWSLCAPNKICKVN